ncbi:hypothetical protein Tco_1063026 [Tanacetum coccineum]
MGSKVVDVHALKEEEFAQITVLGVHVSFPSGRALSFVLMQVQTNFPMGIHQRPIEVKILPVVFHVGPNLRGVVFTYTSEVLFGENLCPVEIRLSGNSYEPCHLNLLVPLVSVLTHDLNYS